MKQILQDMAKGSTFLAEAPTPQISSGHILIQTRASLISAGTERMLVDFGKAGWLDKARQQPEKVKMVWEKIRTDGLLTTVEAVRSKLDQPLPLGYCNVGVVSDVGAGVSGFQVGDRVISNGPHADMVKIPKNLCSRIPDIVSDAEAAFVVVASIGLQGIRLVQPTLGEAFVVTGAGLIGLLTIQLLKAQGCRVLAIDMAADRLDLARQFGAETCNPAQGQDPVEYGLTFSRGQGVDGVIITASTASSDPVTHAARMCRKRGRIVLIGVTGLELNRSDFYHKELSFQVSCSYGPGRYDPEYEDKGHDYPLGFVRWTEQRNFEAVLDMMADKRLDVTPLITHRFAFEDAAQAYGVLTSDKTALGIMLTYSGAPEARRISRVPLNPHMSFITQKPVLGFIGAGNYASRMLIPAFKAAGAQLHTIVTSGGISGVIHGKKSGFAYASTDVHALLENQDMNTIVIVTRHHTHAPLTADALQAGKHVFVEKPLALDIEGLAQVQHAFENAQAQGKGVQLMVGFNRRFAPHIQKIKQLLEGVQGPKSFVMTVNAGAIPADHWTQDREVGGGRIIGEACHFVDLLRFLAQSSLIQGHQTPMNSATHDTVSITLTFADGSIGVIHYFANGSKAFPKERLEIFSQGRVLQLDNFRTLKGYGWPGFKGMRLWRQDKGQQACTKAFLHAIQNDTPAIPPEEIFEVSRMTIELAQP